MRRALTRVRTSMILLVTPLRLEANAIMPVLRHAANAHLHVAGLRAQRLKSIEVKGPVDFVVLAGLAGAIDPSLRTGDVVIDDPDQLVRETRCRRGAIVCSARLLATPADKAAMLHACGAVAVEMEGDAVRALAKERGAPFIHIRAIVDAASDELDRDLVKLLTPSGGLNVGAAIGLVARRPGALVQLCRLRSKTRRALRSLRGAVGEVLQSLPPSRS
jgi:hypothetical protein